MTDSGPADGSAMAGTVLEIVTTWRTRRRRRAGPAGQQFVPFALPGERWRQTGDDAYERLSDAPDRVNAPCPHFGVCGGCVAQHMSDALYRTGSPTSSVRHWRIRALPATCNRCGGRRKDRADAWSCRQRWSAIACASVFAQRVRMHWSRSQRARLLRLRLSDRYRH